jgi:transcription initiation factor TFIIIB Brf1 subunit/transcription initiation factor TFIIB
MLFSDDERRRFSEWLRQEATTAKQLIEQMEKLPIGSALAKGEKIYAAACVVIASRLEKTETVTIRSDAH